MKIPKQWSRGLLSAVTLLVLSSIAWSDTLKNEIQYTLKNNPDIAISRDQSSQANAEIKIAHSKFLPSVDLEGDIGPERSINNNTFFEPVDLTREEAGISLTENVYNGLTDFYKLQAGRYSFAASEFRIANTAQLTAAQVANAYLNVLLEEKLVSLARQNITKHADILALLQKRLAKGLSREADVEQVKSRYDLAKSNLQAELNNLQDAEANYIQVVGREPLNLSAPSFQDRLLPKTLDKALCIAEANNPALHFTQINVLAKSYEYKSGKGSFHPAVDVVLLSRKGNDVAGVEGPNDVSSALVRVRWNLFRGFGDVGNLEKTAAQTQEAFDQNRQTLRAVQRLVRLSWNSLTYNQNKMPDLISHKNTSANIVIVYWQQYTLDKRTLLDVLNAENESFTANRSYEQGRFQLLLAKYDLLSSMGLLLKNI